MVDDEAEDAARAIKRFAATVRSGSLTWKDSYPVLFDAMYREDGARRTRLSVPAVDGEWVDTIAPLLDFRDDEGRE